MTTALVHASEGRRVKLISKQGWLLLGTQYVWLLCVVAMCGCYGWLLWVVAMGGCYGWLLWVVAMGGSERRQGGQIDIESIVPRRPGHPCVPGCASASVCAVPTTLRAPLHPGAPRPRVPSSSPCFPRPRCRRPSASASSILPGLAQDFTRFQTPSRKAPPSPGAMGLRAVTANRGATAPHPPHTRLPSPHTH